MNAKFCLVLALLVSFLAVSGASVQAGGLGTTITVDTLADEYQSGLTANGKCSLREALRAANNDIAVDSCPAGSGADTILLPAGTYTLALPGAQEDDGTTGDLDVTSVVTIRGVSAATTVIDGAALDRVLHVVMPANSLTLESLTVRNGKVRDQAANDGGGIYNRGTLTLVGVTLSGCQARKSGADGAPRGGGIFNAGTLTVSHSLLLNNSASHERAFMGAGQGGGLYNAQGASATLSDTTLSTNNAAGANPELQNGQGGGIYNDRGALDLQRVALVYNTAGGASPGSSAGGGLYNFNGTAVLSNVTLSANRAPGGISFGGGIAVEGAAASTSLVNVTLYANTSGNRGNNTYTYFGATPIQVRNTIIASPASGFIDNCAGGIQIKPETRLTPVGSNLEYPAVSGSEAACGLSVANPKLAALALNAPGETPTHALGAGSAALDVPGSCSGAPGVDQRGVARPQGAACDLGAYEKRAQDDPGKIFMPIVRR